MGSDVLLCYTRCQLTRAAFEAHGHRVWTCDLLPAPGRHLQMDAWSAIESRSWDFGIFHPMCTYLTVSAAWAFKDPDYVKWPGIGYHQRVKPGTLVGAARREAREAELENFRRLLALPFPKRIENPGQSFINTAIRPPDQVVHPNQFGDDASKGTGFWGTHDVPDLVPTKYIEPRLVCRNDHVFAYGQHKCPVCGNEKYLPRWANQTDSGQNRLGPSDPDRWLNRSATYPGIAAALGDQYGKWLNNNEESGYGRK